MSKIVVIGAGFSGLSAAAYLSFAGHEVHVYEKNNTAGGRARQLTTENGYVFDMGPSWYWMPDVYERFFNDFGFSVDDFYSLKLLDPSFDVVFDDKRISIPQDFFALCDLFESIEEGSSARLRDFMAEAKYKYEAGMKKLVYMPGLSLTEFASIDLIKSSIRLQIFSSFSKHVRKYFSHPKLIALMEFPVLFLGAMPQETPALYSLMNYAGLKLGTWYPEGGFGRVVEAVRRVAELNGAIFNYNSPVKKILLDNDQASGILVNGEQVSCDAVIAAADYAHVENELLPRLFGNYEKKYWTKKTFAPSCLIYYLGVSKRIKSIQHHTLFFDEELLQHSKEIYKEKQWPAKPLFYVCCPSQSDENVAPPGHENLFVLMPVAPGLEDNEITREKYFKIMISRLEKELGEELVPFIDFKKSYCINDFIEDYHSYKGNAYGLANTLMQTAILKPKIRNKKLNNFFYAGQLTVPGPGVPPSLISGKIAAQQLLKQLKSIEHEVII
jgi:phytoene desaturase